MFSGCLGLPLNKFQVIPYLKCVFHCFLHLFSFDVILLCVEKERTDYKISYANFICISIDKRINNMYTTGK